MVQITMKRRVLRWRICFLVKIVKKCRVVATELKQCKRKISDLELIRQQSFIFINQHREIQKVNQLDRPQTFFNKFSMSLSMNFCFKITLPLNWITSRRLKNAARLYFYELMTEKESFFFFFQWREIADIIDIWKLKHL